MARRSKQCYNNIVMKFAIVVSSLFPQFSDRVTHLSWDNVTADEMDLKKNGYEMVKFSIHMWERYNDDGSWEFITVSPEYGLLNSFTSYTYYPPNSVAQVA